MGRVRNSFKSDLGHCYCLMTSELVEFLASLENLVANHTGLSLQKDASVKYHF